MAKTDPTPTRTPKRLTVILPAEPEWSLVSRQMILSYANAAGMDSLRLEELAVVGDHLWDEVAYAPEVHQTELSLEAHKRSVSLIMAGIPPSPAGPSGGGNSRKRWSSPVSAAVITHLADEVEFENDRLSIKATVNF